MDAARVLAATVDIVTPVAIVDVPLMERNLRQMAELAGKAGLQLRPHAKTHKMAAVAERQLAHGARGLTVATLQEAEVFSRAGADDLLLAHPPVGAPKLRRLERLAGSVRRLAVSLDNVDVAAALPASVEVFWEVDTGQHRIGTLPGTPTLRAVRELLERLGAARFRGLITHAGYAYAATDAAQREAAADDESQGLLTTAALLRDHGIDVRELSIGSTPTAGFAGRYPGITEMRPGTYVFGDANQVTLGSQRLDECALAVVATVVSVASDRVIVDSGSKAISADLRVPGLDGHGLVLEHDDLILARLSEEHGILSGGGAGRLRIGDRLVIVPAHVCTTVNLHAAILFLEDGGTRWVPVDARGWQPAG